MKLGDDREEGCLGFLLVTQMHLLTSRNSEESRFGPGQAGLCGVGRAYVNFQTCSVCNALKTSRGGGKSADQKFRR